MRNKKILAKALMEEKGLKIGHYAPEMEKLSLKAVQQVIDYGIGYGDSCDVKVEVRKIKYVIELRFIDDEVDFYFWTKKEHDNHFGIEDDEDDEDDEDEE